MAKNPKNDAVGDTLSPPLRCNAEALHSAPDQALRMQANAAPKPQLLSKTASAATSLVACLRASVLLLTMLCTAACNSQTTGEPGAEPPPKKAPIGTPIKLGIVGYNYTNRYIDSFSVGGKYGAGGGNLFVSGPSSGGGGTVCCANYRSGVDTFKVTIRWQTAGCTYNERFSHGERFYDIHHFFKEVQVQVEPNIPDNPRYLEVHIYPDDRVEAVVTEEVSRPRLILSKDREDNSDYPRCPNGKKPQE